MDPEGGVHNSYNSRLLQRLRAFTLYQSLFARRILDLSPT